MAAGGGVGGAVSGADDAVALQAHRVADRRHERRHGGHDAEGAQKAAELLESRSPLSVNVTLAGLRADSVHSEPTMMRPPPQSIS